ncbi:MAG: hypothetical protein AB1458_12815 [Bacteroidota bacterium]
MNGLFWLNQAISESLRDTTFARKCAVSLVEENNYKDIKVLIEALTKEEENVALVSSNILFEISKIKPALLENEVKSFANVFNSRASNVLLNNCLGILTALAPTKHDEIYKYADKISDQLQNDDVNITDGLIDLLAELAKYSKDNNHQEICMVLKFVLLHCPDSNFREVSGKRIAYRRYNLETGA